MLLVVQRVQLVRRHRAWTPAVFGYHVIEQDGVVDDRFVMDV